MELSTLSLISPGFLQVLMSKNSAQDFFSSFISFDLPATYQMNTREQGQFMTVLGQKNSISSKIPYIDMEDFFVQRYMRKLKPNISTSRK